MTTLKWDMKSMTSSNASVPAVHGIYAIGQVHDFLGLPLQSAIVYVGKSMNLHRRLSEHTKWTEVNPGLAEYLRKEEKRVCIWYTMGMAKDELDNIERALVRELGPVFNRVTYKGLV